MNYKSEIDRCRQSLINQWAEGNEQVTQYPWLCYISITNHCNNRCQVCAYSQTMRKDKGILTPETFNQILQQLPQEIKKVYLIKQGEPFLNKHLETFVTQLKNQRPDIHVSLHTNGITAQKERVEKTLPLMDSFGVSISAITPETYRTVHQTDKFTQVQKNLKGICEILLSMGKEKSPHVFIDYVRQAANAHESEADVVEYYKTHFKGLSSVDFHSIYNFQGVIEEGDLDIYNRVPLDKFPLCVFPWSSITFCYDGKVSYCFEEPRENRFLGDITRQSFEEIWNGNEYRKFRERMASMKYDELEADGIFCRKCSWLWNMRTQSPRNLALGYAIDFKKKTPDINISFNLLLDYSPDRLFQLGIGYYLQGEIDRALGVFQMLSGIADDGKILNAVKEMIGYCEKVIKRYEHLPLWQQELKKEKNNPMEKKNKYYKL